MDNLPTPIDKDSEMFLYEIRTTDGKTWFLQILGNGGEKNNFTILESHPEVFGWEEVQGMLKLVTKDPIDPKIIIEAIQNDPIDSLSIVNNKNDQEEITSDFVSEYTKQ